MPAQISLLIDSPLRDLLLRLRGVEADARKQALSAGRQTAGPIWQEELRGRAVSRLQVRVLSDTARVSVTARNIQLKSATAGKLSTGTPVSTLAAATEFGMSPGSLYTTISRKGKIYSRRAGATFGGRQKAGKVVYPAVDAAIPRVTSLIIQTITRSLLDALNPKG
ncbi:hypothetical protein [Leifsonia aquatica]|uniref:hypothetical protein n=1 Tax=Leifsonia aquatica TaxID=144185 RepID=UPI000467F462|nr:hypothetical protein [Leifsonia aquatica]